jgi:dTDP-4-dehydrorhamnose 3,5-epimerase
MEILPLAIKDVLLIKSSCHQDSRGFFSEIYSRQTFLEAGIVTDFIQDNFSLSREVGVIRGLHFQSPPFAQTKLLRVVRGAIFDVVVDIRRGSPTFGGSVATKLTADDWSQLYIPEGFAHGFCTIEPNTEITYKVNSPYSPQHDHGLLWCDPNLDIKWPISPENTLISERDKNHPILSEISGYFEYEKLENSSSSPIDTARYGTPARLRG